MGTLREAATDGDISVAVESLPTQRHPQTPPGTQEAPSLSHRETIGRVLGHLWRVFMGEGVPVTLVRTT